MIVLAIDPGTTESAYVQWNGQEISAYGIAPNESVLNIARVWCGYDKIAIEMIACYGMPVGREVFETCLLIGRMQEAFEQNEQSVELIFRRDVKLHHCLSPLAKDANVRQALIDKYGAPGTKKNPGTTYGIKNHLWAALAIATYITERENSKCNQKSKYGRE